MPRMQIISLLKEKGDYLVRINDQNRIVLSILWIDSTDPNKLKDGHFLINEKDNVNSFFVFKFYLFILLDVFISNGWYC